MIKFEFKKADAYSYYSIFTRNDSQQIMYKTQCSMIWKGKRQNKSNAIRYQKKANESQE